MAFAVALLLGGLTVGPPSLAAPDVKRGEQVYARCLACHAPAFDRVGPRHCGLLGRRAGSVPGFAYSQAMKRSALVWDEKTLDRFLAAPMKAMPGTTMTYDGITDRQERADLIEYLRRMDQSSACGVTSPVKH